MFGMTDGAKECILTAETHAKGTQFAEEAKVDKTDFEMEYVPDESNTQWVKDSVNTLIRAVMNFSGTDVDNYTTSVLGLSNAITVLFVIVYEPAWSLAKIPTVAHICSNSH